MAVLPYVTATGNVERALSAIKAAATPQKVTQDFVKTMLKIPGGSGDQMTSLLRKLGFVNPDGTPSEIYKRFRNDGSSRAAAADALRFGYAPLFKRNEFWPAIDDDKKLRGLIIEETGQSEDSPVVTMVLNTINGVKGFADFDAKTEQPAKPIEVEMALPPQLPVTPAAPLAPSQGVQLRLGYQIHLNLPATSDIAVFNAIFKSLRENLLKADHADD